MRSPAAGRLPVRPSAPPPPGDADPAVDPGRGRGRVDLNRTSGTRPATCASPTSEFAPSPVMPLIASKAPTSPGDATRVARVLHRLALAPDKADEYAKNGIAGE